MVDQLSPLEPVYQPGRFGNSASQIGVTLMETQPGSIVQVAVWPGGEHAAVEAIGKVVGLTFGNHPGDGASGDGHAAFGIGPRKFLVISEDEGLEATLAKAIPSLIGAVTDLSHGRTGIRISGEKAEWVLSKLFAINFAATAFSVGQGVSTKHHEMFAQIQRTGPEQFDIYVFRSFARSFWHALVTAAAETGYEVQ